MSAVQGPGRPLALITGVGRARSIGTGIARRLAPTHDLVLVHSSAYDNRVHGESGQTDAIRAELESAGSAVTLVEADLAEPDSIDDVLAALRRPASVLVLSHTESVDSSIMDTTIESFDRHYAVNVRANWLLIKGFAQQAPGWGRIIALTSDHYVHNLPYGVTKGALDRLVLACTRELADRNITANVLNPGPVDTGWMTDEVRAAGLAQQPSHRFGTPDDIGAVVAFLVGDEGSWINGQLIKADGGFSA
ncbi:SDR family oxidoreductase [Microlunatus endophyticus]|uniref:SDR family oxidoreductase n=1 Tax=Microlunatus endophyticus TaxID=1716077 RepID=UPI0016695D68|nr:SDR family oxidoreductase [Microlunatus endophyticus]